MSDTPRTDSVTFKAEFGMMPICDTVPAVFARQLERELAQRKCELDVMTDQRDVAIQCHEWCRKDRKQISAELVEAHDEIMEQARLLGAGGSREAALISQRDDAWEQRDRLAEAVNAATVLIAAKGRHNTMLAYEGLRKALTAVKGETL
jgi:hypothetical protein